MAVSILGLGNPGADYAATRHNLGFMVLDRLCRDHQLNFDRVHGRSLLAEGKVGGRRLVLAKPTTYMNLSGLAAEEILRARDLEPHDLLVVSDDLNLPLGRLRLRLRGSDGGHKGLASVIFSLGTEDFPRLRLGIGREKPSIDQVRFVLEPFDAHEKEAVEEMLDQAVACLEVFLESGPEEAMGRFNREPLT
ncbi:aminoacyl-tRNA hydrolase [candidate division KSB1 bacterium]